MALTDHEQKILELIQKHPEILTDTKERARYAKKIGLTEKTLRNRIGELKRQGFIENSETKQMESKSSDSPKRSDRQEIELDNAFTPILRYKQNFLNIWIMISLVIGALSFVLPKWYEGRAVILPPSNDSSQFGAGGLSGLFGMSSLVDAFSSSNDGQERFLAILKSDRLMQILEQKFDFQSKYDTDDLESTLKKLRKHISILIEDENQIVISILDLSQDDVADITNETVRILDSLNIELSNTQARGSRLFIEDRVNEVLDSLKSLEFQLTNFMETEGVMSLEDQVSVGVEKAAELQAMITAKEVELSVAEKMMETSQPILSQLRHELIQLKQDYKDFFQSDSNDQLLPSFSDVPELATKLTRLQRAIEYHVKLLEFLGPQYEQAKIDEVKDIPTLQVLDWAVRPEREARPRKIMMILVGLLLGFVLAYLFVYVQDFRNRYLN